MENWKIRQAVDLARSGCGPAAWPEALMVVGDKQAHTWEVVFTDGGAVPDLTGASVTAYFNRLDNETVVCVGSAEGNTVRVTLAEACYAFEGPLVGILRVTQGPVTFTASILRFTVAHGANSVIVDPGDVVPDLTELLAQIANMERAMADTQQATTDANAATTAANTAEAARAAAEEARVSEENARVSAENARVSAENARVSVENTRVSAENARVSAESARISAESARVTAENTRKTQEQQRQTDTGAAIQRANTSAAGADAAAARANTSAADADAAAQSIGAQLTARLGNLAFMLAADGGIDVIIINE
ncbi:MAG: hypothetical protein ACI4OL_08660 [Gemmiger sp.]